MDEVFGDTNFIAAIAFKKTAGQSSQVISGTLDYLLLFAKDASRVKLRSLYRKRKSEVLGLASINTRPTWMAPTSA